MKKSGTTAATSAAMKSKSTTGVRHGPSNKNVNATAKRKPAPKGPTGPLRGPDRGGV